MLTIAYCRVSTDEQAAEGFSIAGQASKLEAYAELHDLGPVTVIEDPGQSGKNLDRPGVQQVLAMVEAGHVGHILVWRLDRISRNLGDLILLADTFGKAGVGLHSFTEKLDLSSATGRMFYNILGSFAQFYREQLAENVKMGQQQAVRQGKWINRPKFGYDLINGELVANNDAPVVEQIFRLRAEGLSYHRIEGQTGVRFSTARSIVHSRIYLGEVQLNGEWYPGRHDPIITEEAFRIAHRAHVPGRKRRSSHVLSGFVRCGLCGRVAATHDNGNGYRFYRCRHRGEGCSQPSRSVTGLEKATVLGLSLLAENTDLQEAVRHHLRGLIEGEGTAGAPSMGSRKGPRLAELVERRRMLLELFYADKLSPDLFSEQETELTRQIAALRSSESLAAERHEKSTDLLSRFDDVVAVLQQLSIEEVWNEATDRERRVLVEELIESVALFPDHLEVTITGVPKLNVTLPEVGLRETLSSRGVGGPIPVLTTRPPPLARAYSITER